MKKKPIHQYQVTKYNPDFRDSGGAYTKDEWTAFSDIGRLYGGVAFTIEEYLRVESAYIDVAAKFLAEDSSPALYAIGASNHFNYGHAPTEGGLIRESDFSAVCRSILREKFWCRLEGGGRFIHFGYDYYMYVGVKSACDSSIAAAHALSLFVERIESPLFPEI